MPPEMSEQEIKALREAKEKAEREAAQVRQAAAALQTQMTQYLAAERAAQQNPRQAENEDPDAFVSKRDLAEWANGIHQQGQQSVQQSAVQLAKNQKAANRALFFGSTDPKYRHAKRYASEIDSLVDQLDPIQAAGHGIYEQIYSIVIGNHFSEVSEIEFAERQAKERAKQTEDEQYEDEEVEGEEESPAAAAAPAPARPAAQPVPRRPESPMPTADAQGARPGARRLKAPPLTAEEQLAAKRFFNGNADEYRAWQRGDVEVDMFGAKGRSVF